MSFSHSVKTEIVENKPMHKHFFDALAYGLFLHCQKYDLKEISIKTKFSEVSDEFAVLAKLILGDDTGIKTTQLGTGEVTYKTKLVNRSDREKLIDYFGEKLKSGELLSSTDRIYAFIAGTFLSCGNITNPQKSYHIEFVTPTTEAGENLLEIISQLLPKYKTVVRRSRLVVYCKDSGQISDTLTMMSASKATLRLIDAEMIKDVRNHANRVTNCETANIDKTVIASTSQIDDIGLLLETIGESGLSEQLRETAKIRIENPYASLRELAELFDPPISRSGLHHRLTSITRKAEQIRTERKRS